MPIYSYHCASCGNEFELRQGFDADPTQECPHCENKARRRIHAVGVIYKGSGFYTTDYARKSSPSSENGSDSPSSKSESKSESNDSSSGSSAASDSSAESSSKESSSKESSSKESSSKDSSTKTTKSSSD